MEKFKPRITQTYIGDRKVNVEFVDRFDMEKVEHVEYMSVYEHEVLTAILREKIEVLERTRPGPKR